MDQPYQGESVSAFQFWSTPIVYRVPTEASGHCYVPLKETLCSAKYDPNLMSYPMLAETLNNNSFLSVINSANFVVKTPYFKHLFVRYILIMWAFIFFINFCTSCGSGDVGGIIINLILLILCPFGMRFGAAQYHERMHKYRKVMQRAMGSQCNTVLLGCGIVVDAGEKCLWLDFHSGSYSPPPVQATYVVSTGVMVNPGNQINY